MASGLHGVNHIACLAKNIDETIAFYKDYLDIPLKNVVNNTPGHIHIALDLGGAEPWTSLRRSPARTLLSETPSAGSTTLPSPPTPTT